jgi:hypothetical protein
MRILDPASLGDWAGCFARKSTLEHVCDLIEAAMQFENHGYELCIARTFERREGEVFDDDKGESVRSPVARVLRAGRAALRAHKGE